ncbi:MAG: beta-ketoacyl-ACP synthase III [Syntrophales bacterium]|nr:beta-ketoacyl-ACP synthase III [Syntrophales bacterium]
MAGKAYITGLAAYLPNEAVANDRMEEFLGRINGKPSRARAIVLRNNGITSRYYAMDAAGNMTHSNAELAANAVRQLFDSSFGPNDMELLCCATTIPDQLMPSHASMVQGCLGCRPIEIVSTAGVCCSGMNAMKYGMLSILSGNSSSAVCTASELASTMFLARNFENEMHTLSQLESRPILAFEKDFLRWMLSDGAGAALLQAQPNNGDGISLQIDWIDTCSFAGETDVCMYAGAEKDVEGKMAGWKTLSPGQWLDQSIFAVKQDIGLLEEHIVKLGVRTLSGSFKKRDLKVSDIDYFLPHISSEYFRAPLDEEMKAQGIGVSQDRWFTNLSHVGNIGSASIYIILEELFHSGRLERGMKVLCFVPESARFTYAVMLLTVC